MTVSLWHFADNPYPTPREVPEPDPYVRDAWLEEIGAKSPDRRAWILTNRTEPEDST